MTNVERVERDIAREKMFREAFMNGKEPTDEDRSAWGKKEKEEKGERWWIYSWKWDFSHNGSQSERGFRHGSWWHTKRMEVIKASYERTVVLLACLFLRFSADIFDRVFCVQSQEPRDRE